MKVLFVNGSLHEEGCTFTALKEAADTLNHECVETDFFWIGNKTLRKKLTSTGAEYIRNVWGI